MNLPYIIQGVIIGIAASIPVGTIAVMVIQRTLSKNRISGLISGMGGAVVDIIYASLGFFFLSLFTALIDSYMLYVKLIGGLFIALAGVKIFMTNPLIQIRRNRRGESMNYKSDFISAMFLSLANPSFMLVFIGYFALFGINREQMSSLSSIFLLLGVLGGCLVWWFSLTFIVNIFRSRMRARHLLWINRIAGGAIILLGVSAVLLMFVDTQVNGII